MDLTSPKNIKDILTKYGARPSKGLGQNFLIDKNILDKIITAGELKPNDVVLEIGPGIGTLTQKLAESGRKIIAVEKDKVMCEILKETLAEYSAQGGPSSGWKNIEIINADILKSQIPISNDQNYKIIANLPYYITSPVIRKFLEAENPPEFMVLMLQKEVAQRICANPPDMSLLSVSVQFYAEPEIISYVSKNCFLPAPKVDSAIIKIMPKTVRDPISHELFFKIVKAGFSQPRKQLAPNLSKMLKISKEETINWLAKNNIDPKQRAETLSVQDWENLAKSYPQAGGV